jgi:hypothetical protein
MASIAGRTNGERAIAETTDLLPERRVHDVGAAVRFDWTRRANRGTRETTGSVAVGASRWSPRVWRDQLQALTALAVARSLRDPRAIAHSKEAVDAAGAVDAQNAPTAPWKTRPERGFPTSAHSHSLVVEKKTKNTKTRPATTTAVQIYAVSGER